MSCSRILTKILGTDRFESILLLSPVREIFNRSCGYHQDSKVKVGRGISHFTVELDSEFRRTRHFMIHRKDGSQTDVSFHSAIKEPNRRRDLLEALRRAVEDQIVNFKLNAFSLEF